MIRIDLKSDELSKPAIRANTFFGLSLPKKTKSKAVGKKNKPKPLDTTMAVVVLLALALSAIPHFLVVQYQEYYQAQYKKRLKEIEVSSSEVADETSKYDAFKKELESYDQQKSMVNSKISSVKSLLDVRNTPVSVLDAIGQSLPNRSWLISLDYSLKKDNSSISLKGNSYSNEEITEFVDKLSQSVYLSDINLEDVGNAIVEKNTIKTFSIQAKQKNGTLVSGI